MAVAELEKVPWLTADDMCKGQIDGPDDTHCLFGWVSLVDPGDKRGVFSAVQKTCHKRDPVYSSLVASNEAHTNQENVELWHLALGSLGWEEGEGYMLI